MGLSKKSSMILRAVLISTFVLAEAAATVYAATARATINSIDMNGVGPVIGTVTFKDTKYGLMVTPDISDLPVGVHGFHIHDKGACGLAEHEGKMAAGFAAGAGAGFGAGFAAGAATGLGAVFWAAALRPDVFGAVDFRALTALTAPFLAGLDGPFCPGFLLAAGVLADLPLAAARKAAEAEATPAPGRFADADGAAAATGCAEVDAADAEGPADTNDAAAAEGPADANDAADAEGPADAGPASTPRN